MPKSKISLSCIECKSKNYTINKSSQERLVLKKFCKKCNSSTTHKEEK
ncbi:50S ribosomal protein L33 [Mesomycoplasma hyorhinis]|uniref:Large ribosomal subunit protein bL33 n=2 Tax=Mesomycoplasma hyorhinis TaxID=2100 RepID=A0AAJ3D6L3_MESHY|nr:50S ribosomal protein L33 [Mesomycoplasma hyorhinis]ADQ08314.1 hypothetical protein MHR_0682 [Mesomycoplasma hyorhinis HUB-1]AEC45716.1 hypothetical protein SRH_00736 [Mesomycoplasma hyorhinis MCLD]AEX14119.1 ribosomal protein L33 [Mesomycoplasma hyorhinis GDL-1]TRM83825.1 50S ribosomal protein L33 [Sulfolobus sp. A20-N-F6]MXR06334.1 50S ribosomal protein L33 [Mesomycoplasma hyorhinis]